MKKSDAAFSATVSQPAAQANYIVRRQFRAEKTINAKVEIEFANTLPRTLLRANGTDVEGAKRIATALEHRHHSEPVHASWSEQKRAAHGQVVEQLLAV